MECKQVNSLAIGFGDAVVIKTKKPIVLNTFEEFDFSNWAHRSHPRFRYEHYIVGGPDKDGFFSGVLCDGPEKDAIHGIEKLSLSNIEKNKTKDFIDNEIYVDILNRIKSLAPEIEIPTVESLGDISKIKSVKDLIRAFKK